MSLTCICCKTLEHIKVTNMNKRIAFESILADCQHGFRSQRYCEPQHVQFYRDMVRNLDRALNHDQKQTDVIIMDLTRNHTGGYCTNLIITGKRIYSQTCGSAHGSLSALKKWCWMVKPQIQSRSYLVYPKDRSWVRSCFSFL